MDIDALALKYLPAWIKKDTDRDAWLSVFKEAYAETGDEEMATLAASGRVPPRAVVGDGNAPLATDSVRGQAVLLHLAGDVGTVYVVRGGNLADGQAPICAGEQPGRVFTGGGIRYADAPRHKRGRRRGERNFGGKYSALRK